MRSRTFCVIWATAAPARNRPASPTKARAALLRRAMLAHQQVCGGGRRLNSRDARLNDEVCGPMDPAAEHRIPRGTRARAPAALEASEPGSGGIAAQGRAASGDIPRPLAPAAADQNARETWTRSCGEIQSGRLSHHPWTERVRDVGVSAAQHVQNRAARGSTHWVMDDAARRSLHIIRVCGGRHHQMGAIPGLDDEDRGRAVPAVEYSTRGGLRARGGGELEVGDLPSGENYDVRATDAGSTPRPIKRTRHTNVRWQKLTAGLRANAERAPLAGQARPPGGARGCCKCSQPQSWATSPWHCCPCEPDTCPCDPYGDDANTAAHCRQQLDSRSPPCLYIDGLRRCTCPRCARA